MRCPVAFFSVSFSTKGCHAPKDLLAWCRTLSDLSAVAARPSLWRFRLLRASMILRWLLMLGRSCHHRCLVVSLSSKRPTTKELRRQFQEADKDGSGEIDATEVASGLTGCVLKRFFFFDFLFFFFIFLLKACAVFARSCEEGASVSWQQHAPTMLDCLNAASTACIWLEMQIGNCD